MTSAELGIEPLGAFRAEAMARILHVGSVTDVHPDAVDAALATPATLDGERFGRRRGHDLNI